MRERAGGYGWGAVGGMAWGSTLRGWPDLGRRLEAPDRGSSLKMTQLKLLQKEYK